MPFNPQATRLLAAAVLGAACTAATAQPEAEVATAVTRVVTLGTQGGPLTTSRRAQPSNAVVVGDRIYLVDAGNGVLRQLAQAGLDYRRIDHIFITHNHIDHNADWGTLMGLQWTTGRSTPVTVYGPTGTEEMLRGYLQYLEPHARIWAEGTPPRRPAREVFAARDIGKAGLVFEDGKVSVTAAVVCHFHFTATSFPPDEVPKAFAYRFETKDRVVVFSGDTGVCPALVDFARGADVLVHEVVSLRLFAESLRRDMASRPGGGNPSVFDALLRHMAEDHTSPEDIGRLASAAGVKRVVLTHFTPGGDSDPEEAYTDGVRRHFTGPVVAAEDLMSF